MRRWIAVFLLFLLPAQFSWAAAAGYCQHETDSTPRHLGHHEHQHQKATAGAGTTVAAELPDAEPPDGRAGSKLPGTHVDCAYCHLSLAKTLTATAPPPLVPPVVPRPLSEVEGASPSLFERIERPNWQRA